jgi:choice-of-anchor B domain-containing protein
VIDLQHATAWHDLTLRRLLRTVAARILAWTIAIGCGSGIVRAADVTFNITFVGQSTPFPPSPTFFYGEVWGEGNYAYVGSDRSGQGISIFDISNPANPQFVPRPGGGGGTTYAGSEMEDVEVYNGIGYFGSDVNPPGTGTGVDIVNLSNPTNPVFLSRVDSSIGGHDKVHTVSVSDGFLYTVDNQTDVVKIFDVSNPSSPQFKWSLDINAPSSVASHEVVVLNDRMYVASKRNDTTGLSCCGWTHIYDVSNVGTTAPVLLTAFESGPRTHTSWPSDDGNILFVAEERSNGDFHIYDISMIDQPNDPDNPVLLKTLNRTNVGIDAHSPHHPFVRGNLLFVAWYEAGLQVFNITDPANPVHVGAFDTYVGTNTNFSGDWGVYPMLGLDRVLLGDRQRGLIIVDATGVLAPGDYDQNGIVDDLDFDTWSANLGTNYPAADGNKNGTVDAADYVIWRKHLGETLPPGLGSGSVISFSPVVPEPATLPLLVMGIAAIVQQRPQRRTRRR